MLWRHLNQIVWYDRAHHHAFRAVSNHVCMVYTFTNLDKSSRMSLSFALSISPRMESDICSSRHRTTRVCMEGTDGSLAHTRGLHDNVST